MHRSKIVRTGDTYTLELPQEFLSETGLHEGDEVALEQSSDSSALIVWLPNGQIGDIDRDRANRIEAIIERRRAMLESLAQR